jgi:hypothetical protein
MRRVTPAGGGEGRGGGGVQIAYVSIRQHTSAYVTPAGGGGEGLPGGGGGGGARGGGGGGRTFAG